MVGMRFSKFGRGLTGDLFGRSVFGDFWRIEVGSGEGCDCKNV